MPGPLQGPSAPVPARPSAVQPVLLLLAALCATWGASPVAAQGGEYGRNKVQYGDWHWFTASTRHFDIHLPANGGAIGEFAAVHLESMYDSVSRTLGFPLKNKVPIILYTTPSEFQQTNIIPYLLPEGVGGFTEIFKNRVVLPFEGSYVDLHHVLQHELCHAFMFDRQNALGNKFSSASQGTPLWFGEGLAEYSSLGWDLGSEFFMMDAVQFGYVGNPAYDGLQGFLAYKGGQLFYYYLSQTFGPEFIRNWVGDVAKGKEMNKAFKDHAKVSLREVGEIWLREIRSIYWPELKERRYAKTVARQLTQHGMDMSNINMQPAISPDGKLIAYFSDLDPMVGIYIMDAESERMVRSLAYSGSKGGHLSFYPYQSRIAWSPDNKSIVFVSKHGDRDVISIARADKKAKVQVIKPPGVQGILSPSYSPDGKKIVFTGMKDGFSDIFVWDLEKKKAKRLTYDIASDQNPVYAPSGKWIAFETDRSRADMPQAPRDPFSKNPNLSSYKDIYRIDTAGGTPSLLVGGLYDEKMPTFGPSDTELVVISNRSGVNNLYIASPSRDTGSSVGDSAAARSWKAMPITNLTSTCVTPSWNKSGDRLAFSIFEDRGWDVFLMRNPRDRIIKDSLPKTRFVRHLEDPKVKFFSPISLENLSSFVRENAVKDSIKVKAPSAPGKGSGTPAGLRTGAAPASIKGDSLAPSKGTILIATAGTAEPGTAAAGSAGAAGGKTAAGTTGVGAGGAGAAASGATVFGPLAEVGGLPFPLVGKDSASASGMANTSNHGVGPSTIPGTGLPPPPKPAEPEKVDSAKVAGSVIGNGETYLTELGAYKLRPYKPKWGMEMAAADLGYNTFYGGVSGQTYLTVSDLLGNHKISFTLSSGGQGFQSTNGLIMYDLLPYRTDFNFMAFNFTNYIPQAPGLYFYDHEWGGGIGARYPLSIFTRFQFDLTGFSITRNLFDAVYGITVPDSLFPTEQLNILRPTVAWVTDNSEYGITGPVLGHRMRFSASAVPALIDDSVAFWQMDADLRSYYLLYKKYSVALRVTGGFSQSFPGYYNPQLYLGGGDDLIPFVARTKPGNAPGSLAEVAFSSLAIPLRGFRYYEFSGDRKFLFNGEFRYPFVETLRIAWPLPITMQYLMGVLFVDYGGAWSTPPGQNEILAASRVLGLGYGYGFRLNLGIFVLRYSKAFVAEGIGIGREEERSYWSLGADF